MNIHGTIINRSDVREGDFDAKVEVFASGRAYEEVQLRGINQHQAWFEASLLGRAEHDRKALDSYARAVLLTVEREIGNER